MVDATVERMLTEGHDLSNHGMNHVDMLLVSEVKEIDGMIEEKHGYQMKLFCPPGGRLSEIRAIRSRIKS